MYIITVLPFASANQMKQDVYKKNCIAWGCLEQTLLASSLILIKLMVPAAIDEGGYGFRRFPLATLLASSLILSKSIVVFVKKLN